MTLRLAMAQLDPVVGDVDGNVERILTAWRAAADHGADLVAFPELAVTGYPPEDLLLKPAFIEANLAAIDRLAAVGPDGSAAVVGFVDDAGPVGDADEWDVTVSARDLRNAAAVLQDGTVMGHYHKFRLPNYGVFDEARYFMPDDDLLVLPVAGVGVGITICEDLWVREGPVARTADAGAEVVVSLNASPFHCGKRDDRERWVRHHATTGGVWVAYVNAVGGQDELVFDGDSMLLGPDGAALARGAQFATDLVVTDLPVGGERELPPLEQTAPRARLDRVAEVWEAVVLGTRDYVRKNGFDRAVIGLSGGIDSAVTAAVAAAALGPEQVLGVGMPSPYSSPGSLEDAAALADNLGIGYEVVGIEPAMEAFDGMLEPLFSDTEPGVAEENVQSRIRGLILMAISNKFGHILLATGNKSEYAVGYATLYGDMAGGFAVLKDVPKTLVYELAAHRNRDGEVIPQSTIDKPPSAELRPDQRDTDALPPYGVLDPIIEAYVEDDRSAEQIIAAGHDEDMVRRVLTMIDRAEYKRRQAPPGVKITDRAFGKDRRVPITTHWRG